MHELWLFLHFFGLAIGAGTPVYMMAIARQARQSGDPVLVKTIMTSAGSTVATVGAIGLTLLILSGLMLAANLGPAIGHLGTTFAAKMVLVVLIFIFLATVKILLKKARQQEGMSALGTLRKIAPVGPVLSVLVILMAVLTFN